MGHTVCVIVWCKSITIAWNLNIFLFITSAKWCDVVWIGIFQCRNIKGESHQLQNLKHKRFTRWKTEYLMNIIKARCRFKFQWNDSKTVLFPLNRSEVIAHYQVFFFFIDWTESPNKNYFSLFQELTRFETSEIRAEEKSTKNSKIVNGNWAGAHKWPDVVQHDLETIWKVFLTKIKMQE